MQTGTKGSVSSLMDKTGVITTIKGSTQSILEDGSSGHVWTRPSLDIAATTRKNCGRGALRNIVRTFFLVLAVLFSRGRDK